MGEGAPLPSSIQSSLIEKLSGIPGAFSVLAFDGDFPVGLCNCLEGFSSFKGKPLVNIHDCYVCKSHRGLGVVDAMFDQIALIAQARGACKITLEVLSNNIPAQKAYRRNGFDAYQLDPNAGHALFWQKMLDPGPASQKRRSKSPARR